MGKMEKVGQAVASREVAPTSAQQQTTEAEFSRAEERAEEQRRGPGWKKELLWCSAVLFGFLAVLHFGCFVLRKKDFGLWRKENKMNTFFTPHISPFSLHVPRPGNIVTHDEL